jgi:lipoprotein-anchoring transpeptidase ErfK/SrfK
LPRNPLPDQWKLIRTALALAAGLGSAAAPAVAARERPSGQTVPPRAAHAAGRALAQAAKPHGFTVVRVRRGERVTLRERPKGAVIARVDARTEFGSPQTLAVAERRGRWLGVTTSVRPNGRLAWVDGRSGDKLQRRHTRVSLRVDLSRRRLDLREGGRTRRSVRVGLGAPGSPTPPGRFAVTDKLSGAPYGGAYGCCILALTGHQGRPPSGWSGGTRLAVHGGDVAGASAGCVRADTRTLRILMREVPLGSPVSIRR